MSKVLSRFIAGLLALGVIAGAVAASGQNYPRKPIRLVTAEPGGGNTSNRVAH
jgi:tripartite-type tricarboxylate transporter receptor subunit TctC